MDRYIETLEARCSICLSVQQNPIKSLLHNCEYPLKPSSSFQKYLASNVIKQFLTSLLNPHINGRAEINCRAQINSLMKIIKLYIKKLFFKIVT